MGILNKIFMNERILVKDIKIILVSLRIKKEGIKVIHVKYGLNRKVDPIY